MANSKVGDVAKGKLDALFLNQQRIVSALRRLGLLQHDAVHALVSDTGTADLAAVVVLANAMKAAYNLHIANTDEHPGGADATNVVTAADATSADQTAANTLLNDIKVQINAHMIAATPHTGVAGNGGGTQPRVAGVGRVTIATCTTTDASTLGTSKTLAAALLLTINAHFDNGVPWLEAVPS